MSKYITHDENTESEELEVHIPNQETVVFESGHVLDGPAVVEDIHGFMVDCQLCEYGEGFDNTEIGRTLARAAANAHRCKPIRDALRYLAEIEDQRRLRADLENGLSEFITGLKRAESVANTHWDELMRDRAREMARGDVVIYDDGRVTEHGDGDALVEAWLFVPADNGVDEAQRSEAPRSPDSVTNTVADAAKHAAMFAKPEIDRTPDERDL